jgi:hypothetical protein
VDVMVISSIFQAFRPGNVLKAKIDNPYMLENEIFTILTPLVSQEAQTRLGSETFYTCNVLDSAGERFRIEFFFKSGFYEEPDTYFDWLINVYDDEK